MTHRDFLSLMDAHKGLLYKLVNLYATDADERKDLLQEIAYQAWKSLAGYKANAAFSTWLYRLSLNTIFTFQRPAKRMERKSHDVQVAPDFNDEREALHWAIRQLPETDRALVSLHLEGYSNEDIADIIGITKNNVAVKLHRIKEHLLTTLRHDGR
jgi:RNA polymerase sigma-70 factor, ECF subfamily